MLKNRCKRLESARRIKGIVREFQKVSKIFGNYARHVQDTPKANPKTQLFLTRQIHNWIKRQIETEMGKKALFSNRSNLLNLSLPMTEMKSSEGDIKHPMRQHPSASLGIPQDTVRPHIHIIRFGCRVLFHIIIMCGRLLSGVNWS